MHGFRGNEATMCMASGENEATMCMASGETRPQCAWLQGKRGHNVHNVHGFRGNEATM